METTSGSLRDSNNKKQMQIQEIAAIVAIIIIVISVIWTIFTVTRQPKKAKDDGWKSTFSPPLSKEMEEKALAKYAEIKAEVTRREKEELETIERLKTCSNDELASMVRDETILSVDLYRMIHYEAIARILKRL